MKRPEHAGMRHMTPQNFPLWTIADDEENKDAFIALVIGWVQIPPDPDEDKWGAWMPVVAHPRQGLAFIANTILYGGVFLSQKAAEQALQGRIEEIVERNRGEGRPW